MRLKFAWHIIIKDYRREIMAKIIVGIVMLIWGAVLGLAFGQVIISQVWLVGSIVILWMPDKGEK